MKTLKLHFVLFLIIISLGACRNSLDVHIRNTPPTLEEIVAGHDIWYVDYHRTIGNNDVPFVSKAFTLSFLNGILYANNNIADIGITGNGLGIEVGNYATFNGVLETNHILDGIHDFEVTVISPNEIKLYNFRKNTSYFLIGYAINNFDYDTLFYENIEYLLQEYQAWEKTETVGGSSNPFDAENYLQFTPENNTTFYSSKNTIGAPISAIDWSYIGTYEIFDIIGFENLKFLTLNYDSGDIEEFELTVIDDNYISLYNVNSKTTYKFEGLGFIQYKKSSKNRKKQSNSVRNSNRKRTKIHRKQLHKR